MFQALDYFYLSPYWFAVVLFFVFLYFASIMRRVSENQGFLHENNEIQLLGIVLIVIAVIRVVIAVAFTAVAVVHYHEQL